MGEHEPKSHKEGKSEQEVRSTQCNRMLQHCIIGDSNI
jgi:hypothetical protein